LCSPNGQRGHSAWMQAAGTTLFAVIMQAHLHGTSTRKGR
jgi:hypothetical protein